MVAELVKATAPIGNARSTEWSIGTDAVGGKWDAPVKGRITEAGNEQERSGRNQCIQIVAVS
jgi:hypothetical protein